MARHVGGLYAKAYAVPNRLTAMQVPSVQRDSEGCT